MMTTFKMECYLEIKLLINDTQEEMMFDLLKKKDIVIRLRYNKKIFLKCKLVQT